MKTIMTQRRARPCGAFKCNSMQETRSHAPFHDVNLEALLDTEVKSDALNETRFIQLEQYLGQDRYLLMINDQKSGFHWPVHSFSAGFTVPSHFTLFLLQAASQRTGRYCSLSST